MQVSIKATLRDLLVTVQPILSQKQNTQVISKSQDLKSSQLLFDYNNRDPSKLRQL